MPYQAEISRTNPACILFLIDQSGSMCASWGGGAAKSKADGVADIINRLLQELVLRCAKTEGVRDYFHVGVVGYGSHTGPAFGGALAGKELVPVSQVGDNPCEIEDRTKKVADGAGGLVDLNIRFPIWFKPVASGGTPMRQAFTVAVSIVRQFLAKFPHCFPPIVINLTDGDSTDGDPADLMRQLTALASTDGQVLLFNFHISAAGGGQIAFPHSPEQLPSDRFARLLFDGASELTSYMREMAQADHGMPLPSGARGYVFNADSVLMIQALDIGTRVDNLR